MKLLEEEGFGKVFLSEEQKLYGTSKELKFQHQNLFFKPAPFYLDSKFIRRLRDREITEEYYSAQFRKEIPKELIASVERFHPHVKDIDLTPSMKVLNNLGSTSGIYFLIIILYYIS